MHSFEFIHIARHHSQIMNQGNSSDLQIIGTDNACPAFKALPERPVKISTFENLDPHIRIQQETHYQVLAGGIGSSSGSSGSSSAQHPMMCAKSGRRRFNSSRVGNSFSFSTSEIASRTRDSSTRAFSGSRRSKVRSNSITIVVTGRRCHGDIQNSTSHFPTP